VATIKAKANERQRAGGREKVPPNSAEASEARVELARIAGVVASAAVNAFRVISDHREGSKYLLTVLRGH